MSNIRILPLQEYKSLFLDRQDLSDMEAEEILVSYKDKVDIDWPSPKTDWMWKITPQGWVGYIPLTDDLHLSLEPKISLRNIFGMLEYAYEVDINLQEDLFESESLQEFYNRLAVILSKLVLDRTRKGIHRDYLSESESLPFLREKLEIEQQLRTPWKVELACQYHEHTADIEDNQILAWTLYCIARSGICNSETLNIVRNAYYALGGTVSLKSITSAVCLNRLYHRLNQDYKQMHALCRFFLEQSGPTHKLGSQKMIPFLIDMNLLFERFVARWLEKHLPSDKMIRVQETAILDETNNLRVQIDMVLADSRTSEILSVLDTKYKIPESPSSSDIEQVIAYADIMNCTEAILVYPGLTRNISIHPGRTLVRARTFDISKNLEQAGERFLAQLDI